MKVCVCVSLCVSLSVSVLHPKGHHSVQLTSHNQWLHVQKSNHPLSASAADTHPQPSSKKDRSALGAAADVEIHLSYSTNRGPIACLQRTIMTDVAAKVTPRFFFNPIDVSPCALSGGAVTVPLVMHRREKKSAFWTLSSLRKPPRALAPLTFHHGCWSVSCTLSTKVRVVFGATRNTALRRCLNSVL